MSAKNCCYTFVWTFFSKISQGVIIYNVLEDKEVVKMLMTL